MDGLSDILVAMLQGHSWTASAVIVVGVVGYVITHIFPLLPVPKAPTGWYHGFYTVWGWVAGNWGKVASPTALPAVKKE